MVLGSKPRTGHDWTGLYCRHLIWKCFWRYSCFVTWGAGVSVKRKFSA